MDLSTLDTRAAESGAPFQPLHPVTKAPLVETETGEPLRVWVLGMDSPEQRAAFDEFQRKLRKNPEASASDVDAWALETLVYCTVKFERIALDGAEVGEDKRAIRKAYTRLPWLREQVSTWRQDRANFLPATSTP